MTNTSNAIYYKRAIYVPKALVCLTTDLNSTEEVLKKLRACNDVEEAYMVYGVYDIIARIKGDSVNKIKQVVDTQLATVNNVQKTLTMVVAEAE
jgi:DNA-binding Lrp family transcriptional regulator